MTPFRPAEVGEGGRRLDEDLGLREEGPGGAEGRRVTLVVQELRGNLRVVVVPVEVHAHVRRELERAATGLEVDADTGAVGPVVEPLSERLITGRGDARQALRRAQLERAILVEVEVATQPALP